jgi:hypothetical protein
VPARPNHQRLLGSDAETNGVLFVLFIPSKDKNGDDLPGHEDQDMWANTAAELLTRLFGGATIMPPARGKWLNEERRVR